MKDSYHEEFPKYMYGPNKECQLINTVEEYEKLLDAGFSESPADFEPTPEKKSEKEKQKSTKKGDQ